MNLKQLIIPALLATLITGCSSTPDADQNGAPVESRDNGIATVDASNAAQKRVLTKAGFSRLDSFANTKTGSTTELWGRAITKD